jgi:hypothetical protein
MITRIKDTGRTLGGIRDTGRTLPALGREDLQKALGASEVAVTLRAPRDIRSMAELRSEILERLKSRGGRPALQGATQRQKIPLRPAEWKKLARLARRFSREAGRAITPAQIAGQLLSSKLNELEAR